MHPAPAYAPVSGEMGGTQTTGRMPSRIVSAILCIGVMTLIAAIVAAVFAGLNFGILSQFEGQPLVSGALSSDACPNAATLLMENVQTAACASVAACPAGDLDCSLCKCHNAASSAPGPAGVITCSCASILDASGSCVSGAPLDKCTTCQFAKGRCTA